jgi:hypothetical protein
MNKEKMLNYERLNAIVKDIELIIIKEEELDFVEQKLLYDVLLDRRQDKINNVKMNDSVSNMPFGNIVNKFMKGEQK